MGFDLLELLMVIPAVLLSLTFHEAAHGYVAYLLGDPTARNMGRLTLNPIRHIDPLGLLSMIFLRFGWAKPVPVNPVYFRKPRLHMAYVALAGPIANVVMSFFAVLLFYALLLLFPESTAAAYAADFLAILASLSVGFAVFNLLPLPPLDGSRVATLLLPARWAYGLMRYERYIQIVLILLLMIDVLSAPLSLGRSYLLHGIESIVRWIVL